MGPFDTQGEITQTLAHTDSITTLDKNCQSNTLDTQNTDSTPRPHGQTSVCSKQCLESQSYSHNVNQMKKTVHTDSKTCGRVKHLIHCKNRSPGNIDVDSEDKYSLCQCKDTMKGGDGVEDMDNSNNDSCTLAQQANSIADGCYKNDTINKRHVDTVPEAATCKRLKSELREQKEGNTM